MVKKPATEKLQIISQSMNRDEFNIVTVAGQARNVTSRTLTCAQVNAKFYDPKGKWIKTLSAVADDLGPGKTWDYFIVYHRELSGEKVARAKVEEGISW